MGTGAHSDYGMMTMLATVSAIFFFCTFRPRSLQFLRTSYARVVHIYERTSRYYKASMRSAAREKIWTYFTTFFAVDRVGL